MNFFLNTQARDLFQVKRAQFNKQRAIRIVAQRFNVSQAEVARAAVWW